MGIDGQIFLNDQQVDLSEAVKINVDEKKEYSFSKGYKHFFVFRIELENGNKITAKVEDTFQAVKVHKVINDYFAYIQEQKEAVTSEND